ncbi:hypothetical protein GCM10010140_68990 [Streptosporangium pseudovulgare]|uniref:Uncharacterized protein n=1 Tax=Streptosporangium pseudovulgare TaxID=35765 RepID=A0ABQ2RJ31_9ACTN|nr:hypothetical protein GCM10010140_68990 [Streptosporangium pseudovulgare]
MPVIRTTARAGRTGAAVNHGQLRYVTDVDGRRVSGNYPFVAEPVDPFEVVSLEFLEPGHPVHALRPADPLQIVWGLLTPILLRLSGRRVGDGLTGRRPSLAEGVVFVDASMGRPIDVMVSSGKRLLHLSSPVRISVGLQPLPEGGWTSAWRGPGLHCGR